MNVSLVVRAPLESPVPKVCCFDGASQRHTRCTVGQDPAHRTPDGTSILNTTSGRQHSHRVTATIPPAGSTHKTGHEPTKTAPVVGIRWVRDVAGLICGPPRAGVRGTIDAQLGKHPRRVLGLNCRIAVHALSQTSLRTRLTKLRQKVLTGDRKGHSG
jgi:hypothetical protein